MDPCTDVGKGIIGHNFHFWLGRHWPPQGEASVKMGRPELKWGGPGEAQVKMGRPKLKWGGPGEAF